MFNDVITNVSYAANSIYPANVFMTLRHEPEWLLPQTANSSLTMQTPRGLRLFPHHASSSAQAPSMHDASLTGFTRGLRRTGVQTDVPDRTTKAPR